MDENDYIKQAIIKKYGDLISLEEAEYIAVIVSLYVMNKYNCGIDNYTLSDAINDKEKQNG